LVLTKAQCNALVKELYQGKTTERQQRLAIRNVTMASLMLNVGLRTTEVVNLVQSDLVRAGVLQNTLLVTRGLPRGHGTRLVDLDVGIKYFVRQMEQYWWVADSDKPGNFAFYDMSPLKHITSTQFRRIINKAGMNALDYPVRPNMLRLTCKRLIGKDSFYS